MQNMAVDPVLALVANGRWTEIDWNLLEDQELFTCSYNEGKIVILLVKPLLLHSSASGTKGRKGKQLKAEQRY